MPKTILPFADGFYETDAVPISSQNCVNLYTVIEEDGGLSPETLRGCPGCELVIDSDPACIAYSCSAFANAFPQSTDRFMFSSATPDVSDWLPWPSGAVTFTHRYDDPFNNQPNGTGPLTSLGQVNGVSRSIYQLSSRTFFEGEIPDLCGQENYIFDHNGNGGMGGSSIAWAFGEQRKALGLSCVMGPGRSADLLLKSQTNRGTRLIEFKGSFRYEWTRPSTGETQRVNVTAVYYVSASASVDSGEIELRLWTGVGSNTENSLIGKIPIDEGFLRDDFSFWLVTLRVEEGFRDFDILSEGQRRRGPEVTASVQVRYRSRELNSGGWVTSPTYFGACPSGDSQSHWPSGAAPDIGTEYSENPVFSNDRIGVMFGGVYSIASVRTHDNDLPDMESFFLAWIRNRATYEISTTCPNYVDPIKVTDPNWENVFLRMNFETGLVDLSNAPKAVTIIGEVTQVRLRRFNRFSAWWGSASIYNGLTSISFNDPAFELAPVDKVWTLEGWVLFLEVPTTTGEGIFFNGNLSSNNHRSQLSVGDDLKFSWYKQAEVGTGVSLKSTTEVVENRWYFWRVVQDGVNRYLFIDGVLEASDVYSTAITADSRFYLGVTRWSGSPRALRNAVIDDVRGTNLALSTNSFSTPTQEFPLS